MMVWCGSRQHHGASLSQVKLNQPRELVRGKAAQRFFA